MKEFDPRVYIVTDRTASQNRNLQTIVEQAIRGGATIIQLREKETPEEEMIVIGHSLHMVTARFGIPLIVNDNLEVMRAINAEGLHIGKSDMSVRAASRLLGSEKILGVSAKTVDEARKAQRNGADYLGVGPIFATRTKQDAGEPIGLKTLSEIVTAVSIPVVAIGGITAGNAKEVLRAGASGIAVVSAVMGARNPEEATRILKQLATSA